MANIQSAKKRARQNVKRRLHNTALRSRVRTAVRKVLKAIESGNQQTAQASLRAAVPEIDRMAGKGTIRKNRAAHYKNQLNGKIKAMK
ncbi:MAG: 30S ribosomal protein S20 [Gammaproteobacteria bacterium]